MNETGSKIIVKHELLTSIVTCLAVVVSFIAGAILMRDVPRETDELPVLPVVICVTVFLLPFLATAVEHAVLTAIRKRLRDRSPDKVSESVRKKVEKVRSSWKREFAKVKAVRVLLLLKMLLFIAGGMEMAAFVGYLVVVLGEKHIVPSILAAACMTFFGVCRIIPLDFSKMTVEEDSQSEDRLKEDSFPVILGEIKRAAETLGVDANIYVLTSMGTGTGIGEIDRKNISVSLDVKMLGLISREELYAVMLHEFAHIKSDVYEKIRSGEKLFGAISFNSNLRQSAVFSRLFSNPFYKPLEAMYCLSYYVFSTAFSVVREADADKKAFELCDKRVAASALVKISYEEMFEWESGTYDIPEEELLYFSEEVPCDMASRRVNAIREQVKKRSSQWLRFRNREIMARNASHPTLKMRLEALGINDFGVCEEKDDPEYEKEVEETLRIADRAVAKILREQGYEVAREREYLKSKAVVEEWEKNGRPLDPVKYGDVHDALRDIGRYSDSRELAERAINEFPSYTAARAIFFKAADLLHRFDPAGIDLMYKAVDENHNYELEGIEMIARFCLLTGNEEELERIRKKRDEILVEKHNVTDKLFDLKKGDKLTREQLPPGVLEKDLENIVKAGEGLIDKIYLVRKTVKKDAFTSIYVIRFLPDVLFDKSSEVMHNIFMYLDTVSDWQYSLYDFRDIQYMSVDRIEGSLVWSKEDAEKKQ